MTCRCDDSLVNHLKTFTFIYKTMKLVILLLGSLAIVAARPQDVALITKYDFSNTEDGGYSYSWESSDGITREESLSFENAGQENEIPRVKGSYSYMGPDGVLYKVYYTADENGFQPEGDHIPQSAGVKKPPQLGIPSAALASLSGGGLG